MALNNLTLFDLATLARNDAYTGLIEDVTTLPREFDTISAVKRDGTWYWIVKRVVYPTAQFRQVNQGTSTSKSVYKKEVKEMLFIDVQLQMDEAIWDADDSSVGQVWQLEAEGAMRAAAILIGQQTYYGTSADSNGFAGFRSMFSAVTKAGGTTSTTSAYLIWENEREGVRYDVGRDGAFAISAPMRQQVVPSSGTVQFAYVGNLRSYIGLFVGSNLSVFGITGIQTTVTTPESNPLTDLQAQQLYASIPAMRRNNLRWYMNRTAESILQQNRSAVIPTAGIYSGASPSGAGTAFLQTADSGGRPAFSPMPTHLNGWPIEITDSILNTETNS